MTTQPQPNSTAPAPARAPIRLGAQVLTCLVLCLLAAPIIWFTQPDPLAVFTRPATPLMQLLIGQGLALAAAAMSWLLFRLTASSASSARTIESYARLD